MVQLVLYELTNLIAPNNVSVVRIKLNDAAKLRLNPQTPHKPDETKVAGHFPDRL